MTGTLGEIILTLSASIELSVIVKATLILLIGLLGARLARRARAARRYLVLAATFTVLLPLPIAALMAPPLAIAIRSVPVVSAPPSFPAPSTDVPAGATVRPSSRVTPSHVARESAPGWTMPPLATALRMVWVIGFGLCLMPVAFTLWRLRLLRRSAVRWAEGEARARGLAAEAGVHREVMVLRHARVAAPMTDGLFTPVILLPVDVPDWSDADLERALVHELEHVRRIDWPAHLLARTACAIYWFHPLVWRAWRLFHLNADRACDDVVVARGEGGAFAEQLVTMAQRISSGSVRPILAMAGRGDLSQRVSAVLDVHQARGRAGIHWAVAATFATMAAVAVISPLAAVERVRAVAMAADLRPDIERPAAQTPQRLTGAALPRRVARAQAPLSSAPPDPFQTASIRSTVSGAWGGITPSAGGDTFEADNVSVDDLIMWAYGIGQSPRWRNPQLARPWATIEKLPFSTDRFDIRAQSALAVPRPPAGQLGAMHVMMQRLLADRFSLTVHWEPRPRRVYVLTQIPGGPRPPLRGVTRVSRASPAGVDGGTQMFVLGPLDALVKGLESTLGDQVVDRTGFTESFDISLRFTRYTPGIPDRSSWSGAPQPRPLADGAVSPEYPVLADALRELGILLTVETVDEPSLVIDRVERPVLD